MSKTPVGWVIKGIRDDKDPVMNHGVSTGFSNVAGLKPIPTLLGWGRSIGLGGGKPPLLGQNEGLYRIMTYTPVN